METTADISGDPRNLKQAAKAAQLGLPSTDFLQPHGCFGLTLPSEKGQGAPISTVGMSGMNVKEAGSASLPLPIPSSPPSPLFLLSNPLGWKGSIWVLM